MSHPSMLPARDSAGYSTGVAAVAPPYPWYSTNVGSPQYGQVFQGYCGVAVPSGQQRLVGSGGLSHLGASLDSRPVGPVPSPVVRDKSPLPFADRFYGTSAPTSAPTLGAPRSRSVPRTVQEVSTHHNVYEESRAPPRSYVPGQRSRSITPRPPARPAQATYIAVDSVDCRESGSDIPTPGSTGNQLGPVRRPAPPRRRRQEQASAAPATIHQTSEALHHMESCLRGLEEENARLKMSRQQSPRRETGGRSSIERLEVVLDRLRQDLLHVQQEVIALRTDQSTAERDAAVPGRSSRTQPQSPPLRVEPVVATGPGVGSQENDTPTFAGGVFDGFPTLDPEPPRRERCPDDEDCSIM
mmetsp:Transcript_58484/g.156321  ORF Transcript_58484/g.156321 Transcript_58484/m.156321 type:complete len:356 (-) Transcript_58484:68-1135(-)